MRGQTKLQAGDRFGFVWCGVLGPKCVTPLSANSSACYCARPAQDERLPVSVCSICMQGSDTTEVAHILIGNLQAPPPDATRTNPQFAPTSKFKRPWFPVHASSQHVITSYQSGAVPTFNDSQAGGAGAADSAESQINQWETRFGMRVEVLAACAYILGPMSGESTSSHKFAITIDL